MSCLGVTKGSDADTQYARLQDEYQKGMLEVSSRMDKLCTDLQSMTSRSK